MVNHAPKVPRAGVSAVLPVLAAAGCLRLLAAIFHRFIGPLPDSGADALKFERIAWEWAEGGILGLPEHFTLGAYTYSWLISVIYAVTGRDPFVPQLVNVFLGTATVYLVYMAAREVWGSRPAMLAAWGAALWPSLILYSAIPMREAIFLFFLVMGVLGACRWAARSSNGSLAVAGIGFAMASVFHGSGLVALGVLCVGLAARLLSALRRGERGAARLGFQAGFFYGVAGIAALLQGNVFALMGGRELFELETIALRQSWANWASSGYLETLIPYTWFDILWQTPIRMFYFLFSPMPWDLVKPQYFVGFLDGLLYLGLTIGIILAARVLRHRPATWFILLVIGVMVVVFALNTFNAGTALRHRAKLAPLFLMLIPALYFLPTKFPKLRRLLLVVNDPSAFFPHRDSLASRAKASGWEVHVAGPAGNGVAEIEAAGWVYHPVRIDRRNLNPWRELLSLFSLVRVLRKVRPSLVHAFALKPILHGGLAARLTRTHGFVGTVTGLGYIFIRPDWRASLARLPLIIALSLAFDHRRSTAVFQNDDDRAVFCRLGIIEGEHTTLIPGSGVDPNQYLPVKEPEGPTTFLMASRMLVDKGVVEFVEAARLLQALDVDARFVLVGDTDPGNPAAIPRQRLEFWQREGIVEWWGHRNDMQAVYSQTHVVCLPSYREGIPRTLLEGAMMGRPLIATDTPGCRDVCKDGENGLLVPVGDTVALSDAMERLVLNAKERHLLGRAGRRLVESGFAKNHVESLQLALYHQIHPPLELAKIPMAQRDSLAT